MATTANYGWTKPTVGGDTGAWGGELNTDLDGIDTTVAAVSAVANAALPKAGGTMTGNVAALTVDYPSVAKGNQSGAVTFDLSAASVFTLTVTGNITSVTPTNVPASGRARVLLLEMTNGGAHTITWGAAFKFASGTPPLFSSTGTDIVAFITIDGGTTWICTGAQLAVA